VWISLTIAIWDATVWDAISAAVAICDAPTDDDELRTSLTTVWLTRPKWVHLLRLAAMTKLNKLESNFN